MTMLIHVVGRSDLGVGTGRNAGELDLYALRRAEKLRALVGRLRSSREPAGDGPGPRCPDGRGAVGDAVMSPSPRRPDGRPAPGTEPPTEQTLPEEAVRRVVQALLDGVHPDAKTAEQADRVEIVRPHEGTPLYKYLKALVQCGRADIDLLLVATREGRGATKPYLRAVHECLSEPGVRAGLRDRTGATLRLREPVLVADLGELEDLMSQVDHRLTDYCGHVALAFGSGATAFSLSLAGTVAAAQADEWSLILAGESGPARIEDMSVTGVTAHHPERGWFLGLGLPTCLEDRDNDDVVKAAVQVARRAAGDRGHPTSHDLGELLLCDLARGDQAAGMAARAWLVAEYRSRRKQYMRDSGEAPEQVTDQVRQGNRDRPLGYVLGDLEKERSRGRVLLPHDEWLRTKGWLNDIGKHATHELGVIGAGTGSRTSPGTEGDQEDLKDQAEAGVDAGTSPDNKTGPDNGTDPGAGPRSGGYPGAAVSPVDRVADLLSSCGIERPDWLSWPGGDIAMVCAQSRPQSDRGTGWTRPSPAEQILHGLPHAEDLAQVRQATGSGGPFTLHLMLLASQDMEDYAQKERQKIRCLTARPEGHPAGEGSGPDGLAGRGPGTWPSGQDQGSSTAPAASTWCRWSSSQDQGLAAHWEPADVRVTPYGTAFSRYKDGRRQMAAFNGLREGVKDWLDSLDPRPRAVVVYAAGEKQALLAALRVAQEYGAGHGVPVFLVSGTTRPPASSQSSQGREHLTTHQFGLDKDARQVLIEAAHFCLRRLDLLTAARLLRLGSPEAASLADQAQDLARGLAEPAGADDIDVYAPRLLSVMCGVARMWPSVTKPDARARLMTIVGELIADPPRRHACVLQKSNVDNLESWKRAKAADLLRVVVRVRDNTTVTHGPGDKDPFAVACAITFAGWGRENVPPGDTFEGVDYPELLERAVAAVRDKHGVEPDDWAQRLADLDEKMGQLVSASPSGCAPASTSTTPMP